MKKMLMFVLPAFVLGVVSVASPAWSQTVSDWSVKLTFSTRNTADLLPVTVGESATTREVPKPPPMPGFAVTGNVDDNIVNAYIRSASRKAAESVAQIDETSPGRIWAVEVNAEETGADVNITAADLSTLPAKYTLSVIDPTTGTRTKITQANTPVKIFTTGSTAAAKTVYIMAGTSNTFAVADGGNVTGNVDVPRIATSADRSGIKVYIDGQEKATSATSGTFSFTGETAGTHKIVVDGPNLLGSTGSLVVGADGTAAVVISDPKGGDANDDCKVNLADFMYLKKCFNLPAANEGTGCTQEKYDKSDFNKDGVRNLSDFMVVKTSFGIKETTDVNPTCQ